MVEASDHVYVLRQTYACRMDLPAKYITGTWNGMWNKYMRHAYVCRKTYTWSDASTI